jgi:hypothetical protein
MADTSALDALKTRVKDQRRELKQLLKLVEVAEGLDAALTLLDDDDEAGDVNVEVAHNGDILFAFDLDALGDLDDIGDARQALVSFLQQAQALTQAAVAEGERSL